MRRMLACFIAVAVILVLAGGCSPDAVGAPPVESRWLDVRTLARTQQADAPAILPGRDSLLAAWVGVDEVSPRIGVTAYTNGDLLNAALLDLLLVYPHAPQLIPALNGNTLLFWLDAPYGETDLGTRLSVMLLSPGGDIVRFPARISTARTARYSVMPNGDGSAWVVWSGGPVAEPDLTIHRVDPLARPRAGTRIVRAGDWPALVRSNNGETRLFWLSAGDSTVRRGLLNGETLSDVVSLVESPPLFSGDRLDAFTAALDRTHIYLFWTIIRAGGIPETWFSAAPIEADDSPTAWSEPQAIGVVPSEAPFTTGFNGGAAQFAINGLDPVRYAVPMHGQFDVLPLAAQWRDSLAVVYMRRGEVAAVQPVVDLAADLIGYPVIATDRDLHLYVAWAAWIGDDYGDLRLVSTRQVTQ